MEDSQIYAQRMQFLQTTDRNCDYFLSYVMKGSSNVPGRRNVIARHHSNSRESVQ